MTTTHEARARNAKAQVFAAILHEHKFGRLNRPGTLLEAVRSIKPEHWVKMAELATMRNMQGVGVTVHPPHSQATVDAVARILGDLIAHRDEQAALAEAHAEPTVYAEGVARSARDSVGYRQQMARVAPQPETTEADLFAPFGQADRR